MKRLLVEIWKVKATLVRVQRQKRRAGEKAYIFFRQYKDNHEWNAGRNIHMKVVSGEILDRKKKQWIRKSIYFQHSGRGVIEDPDVMYVGECFAYVLL